MAAKKTLMSRITKNTDLIIVAAILFTVIMMIIPLPTILLDFLLTLNISIAIIVLVVTMYNSNALQFSVFPSLLLVMTLFRLSLNISSTRLILLHGQAGQVIQTFGEVVLGGNAVVGFIIFLILVIIQFLVITKGAERVAEVAARFTLDAMPGKQMSIDADLNAGLITDKEARDKRQNISREADFYGAMDGASKFVKGDAIAAIIIVIINVLAGFVIGMLQMNMDALTALKTFTVLSVGDGLVSQIPALLISTATGIIVTRASSENNMGQDVTAQVFTQPRVLFIASVALVVLAILGMPKIPFLLMAAMFATIAYTMNKTQKATAIMAAEAEKASEIEEIKKPENVVSLLHLDVLELEIGYSLIPLVDSNQGGDLLDRVIMIRRQLALEMGIVLPPIRMRDNMQLAPNDYVVKIKGVEIAHGDIMVDHYMAMNSGLANETIDGIETQEPAFGFPALWITAGEREKAEMAGYTVVDPSSIVATHLTEIVRTHAWEVLGRQDTQNLIDNIKQTHPAVVEDLIPSVMTLGEVQKVLVNLLKERVSIRDLVTILETLSDYGKLTKDPEMLTEYVRQALARNIIKQYKTGETLHVLTLDPTVEQAIRDGVQHTEQGSYVVLDPEEAQTLYANLKDNVEELIQKGVQPIILCAPVVRIYFKRLTEKVFSNLTVLSYNELDANLQIQTEGVVNF